MRKNGNGLLPLIPAVGGTLSLITADSLFRSITANYNNDLNATIASTMARISIQLPRDVFGIVTELIGVTPQQPYRRLNSALSTIYYTTYLWNAVGLEATKGGNKGIKYASLILQILILPTTIYKLIPNNSGITWKHKAVLAASVGGSLAGLDYVLPALRKTDDNQKEGEYWVKVVIPLILIAFTAGVSDDRMSMIKKINTPTLSLYYHASLM